METQVINVSDMKCAHCEKAVTNGLTPIVGVGGVSVDLAAKTVSVTFDPSAVSLQELKDSINELGFEAV